MNRSFTNKIGTVFVLAGILVTSRVGAGDLNPPPGPIAPTQRTPIGANTTPGDALSLFKITQSGSYYLTGNITGVVGKHGIEIESGAVTIDLMGFALVGVPGSLDGVHVTNPLNDIAVINGSVQKWERGINLSSATHTRVADVQASSNVSTGILTGSNAVVTKCGAHLNGSHGVFVSSGTVFDCSARNNTGAGIVCFDGCMVANSSSGNNGTGISLGDGNSITNCAVDNNNGIGIDASEGNTITNCTVSRNTLDGIRVLNSNTIRGNNCYRNGDGGDGAGIHAEGSDNRIDLNNSTLADRGIDVDFAGNFITRNTCSGNTTNWDVIVNNNLLVVIAVDAAAVVGNSGGVSPGSTDPNANFSY